MRRLANTRFRSSLNFVVAFDDGDVDFVLGALSPLQPFRVYKRWIQDLVKYLDNGKAITAPNPVSGLECFFCACNCSARVPAGFFT